MGALLLLGLIVLGGCGILSVFFFERAQGLEKASAKRQIQTPSGLTQSGTTGKLLSEERLEPPSSVTERTTDLLFAEKKGSDQ